MKLKLNADYGTIFAVYWMFYGVVNTCGSAFLLDKGYSNSEIGIIFAIASVLSVTMQPLLADIADRSKRLDVINLSGIVTVINLAFTACLFVFTRRSVALWFTYVMIIAWMQPLQPLFNSFAAKLSETGHHINYGIARGIGSLGYSILIAFLGTLVERKGVMILPKTGVILLCILSGLIVTLRMAYKKAMEAPLTLDNLHSIPSSAESDRKVRGKSDEEEINLIQFMKRNKTFVLLNVGVIFLFFQNSVTNNYMYQIVENVGGTAEDMGRICSVMAFVELPSLFLFDRINKKYSCQFLLKFASVAFTLKVFTIYLSTKVWMIYAAHFFHIFCFGVFMPAMVAFIDDIMAKGEAVKGQSLYITCITISGIFSSVVGGVILDISGSKAMLLVSWITAAIGTVMIFMLVDRIKRDK